MDALASAMLDFLNYARTPLTSVKDMPEGEAAFHVPPIIAVLQAARNADGTSLNRAIVGLKHGLQVPDTYQASRLAQVIGMLVEMGGDPTLAIAPLLNRLEQQLASAVKFVARLERAYPGEDISGLSEDMVVRVAQSDLEGFKAWRGLTPMVLPAMTMLARHKPARKETRTRPQLQAYLDTLQSKHSVAWYLWELLRMADDEELLVLYPDAGQGFLVNLEAVRNNFHLFTLLQCFLLNEGYLGAGVDQGRALLSRLQRFLLGEGRPEGTDPDSNLCAVARGEAPLTALETDYAVWHYYQWPALQPDGSLQITPWSVWGEQRPTDILAFDNGPRIVILGPRIMADRTWDANFFAPLHEALRSRITLKQTFGREEVAQWMARIRAAPREA